MQRIKGLLLGVFVSLVVAGTGCQGADYPGTDSTATASPPAAEETVTEKSELCVDNLTGSYVATWSDGVRAPVSMDMRLSTYIASCFFYVPQGQIVGGMSWFTPGPHNTALGAFGSNKAFWNGSHAVFYANDAGGNWWQFNCTTAGTFTNGWNCLFNEWSGTNWLPDGTFTLRGY